MKILLATLIFIVCSHSIAENPISRPAIIVITDKFSVDEDSEVILYGGESIALNGSLRSFSWKQISGIPMKFSSLKSKRITFTPPNLDKGHHIKISLKVWDSEGLNDTKYIKIFIRNTDRSKTNISPVAVTGGDQIVNSGDIVFLPCNLSYDTDGSIVKCVWRQTGGPAVDIKYTPTGIAYYIAPNKSGITAIN